VESRERFAWAHGSREEEFFFSEAEVVDALAGKLVGKFGVRIEVALQLGISDSKADLEL